MESGRDFVKILQRYFDLQKIKESGVSVWEAMTRGDYFPRTFKF